MRSRIDVNCVACTDEGCMEMNQFGSVRLAVAKLVLTFDCIVASGLLHTGIYTICQCR